MAATQMNGCEYLDEILFKRMKQLLNSGSLVSQRKQGNIASVPEMEWNCAGLSYNEQKFPV